MSGTTLALRTSIRHTPRHSGPPDLLLADEDLDHSKRKVLVAAAEQRSGLAQDRPLAGPQRLRVRIDQQLVHGIRKQSPRKGNGTRAVAER